MSTSPPSADPAPTEPLPPQLLAAAQKYPGLAMTLATGVEWRDGRELTLLRWLHARPDVETHLRGNPTAVLAAMDEFAAQHAFLINIGADKARRLGALCAAPRVRTYVEVGGYLGYSAVVAGMALRGRAGARVWSVEVDAVFAGAAMAVVALAGLAGVVSVVVGAPEGLLPLGWLQEAWGGRVDLLLLDHDEALYGAELLRFREAGVLKEGAVVVADNVLRPGAPEYRKMVRELDWASTEAIKALIQPGDMEDEMDVTRVTRD